MASRKKTTPARTPKKKAARGGPKRSPGGRRRSGSTPAGAGGAEKKASHNMATSALDEPPADAPAQPQGPPPALAPPTTPPSGEPASTLEWVLYHLGIPQGTPAIQAAAAIGSEITSLRADKAHARNLTERLDALDNLASEASGEPASRANRLRDRTLLELLGRIARALEESHEAAYVVSDLTGRPTEIVPLPRRIVESVNRAFTGRRFPAHPLEALPRAVLQLQPLLERIAARLGDEPEDAVPDGHLPEVRLTIPKATIRELLAIGAMGGHLEAPPITLGPGLELERVIAGARFLFPHIAPEALEELRERWGAEDYVPRETTSPGTQVPAEPPPAVPAAPQRPEPSGDAAGDDALGETGDAFADA